MSAIPVEILSISCPNNVRSHEPMRESYDGARTEFLTQISVKSLAHPLGYDTTNSLRARDDGTTI